MAIDEPCPTRYRLVNRLKLPLFLPIGSREYSVLKLLAVFSETVIPRHFPPLCRLSKFQCNRQLAGFLGNPYYFTAETFLNATLMCGINFRLKRQRQASPTKIATAISSDGDGHLKRHYDVNKHGSVDSTECCGEGRRDEGKVRTFVRRCNTAIWLILPVAYARLKD